VDDITNTWKLQDAEVAYNQDWISRFGGYEGGPNRSFGGNYYQGGYSDHLPSLIYLKRVALDDIDKDGITDKDDKCPELPGLKAFNGCPDSDEDGIEDSKDSCPEEKGELANNGCPWLDSDGDSVLDKDDKCPETKGLVENQGCPELKEAIKAVFENLVFDTDKFTIQKSSDDELIALADLLKNNSELLINISGHTDNVSDDIRNMDLSKNRAYAVKDRLASLGIAPKRMEVLYFGETQPIESNDTETGRQANRRVVFEVRSK
jgi:outer membrane protein OmpA-like peptidoglycan-associated protein